MHSMLENMYCTKIATFIVLNETVKVLLTYGIWRIKDNKKYLKKYLKGKEISTCLQILWDVIQARLEINQNTQP